MIRLAISVEGETEEEFVKGLWVIRAQCPPFDRWLTQLETLGD